MRAAGILALALAGALQQPGCATPAAPATPAAAPSDPAAAAVVDAMIEAAGGAAAWAELRELGWLQGLVVDGMLVDAQELVWDRDGERLRHVWVDTSGAVTVVLRGLEADGGHAEQVRWSGTRMGFSAGERARLLAYSQAIWEREGFLFALPFSLRWPELRVSWVGERARASARGGAAGPARYDVLRVQHGGGPEEYRVIVSRDSRRPVLVEIETPGRAGREGWLLRDWRPAGGVVLATRREALPREAGATALPFVMPVKWRGRVALEPAEVPVRGMVVVIGAVSGRAEVDPGLFVPSVRP